jgi:hypothetical protein
VLGFGVRLKVPASAAEFNFASNSEEALKRRLIQGIERRFPFAVVFFSGEFLP